MTIKSTSKKYHKSSARECRNHGGTARQYHKNCIQGVLQKYTKRVSQSRVQPAQSKEIPGSVTIKNTVRDRNYQKYCFGPPQSKLLPGSAVIKYIQGVQQTEVKQGSAIIKMITGECNMQKYCQGCHNQKYCKGISQSKELTGSVTIKGTFRECHNRNNYQGMPNQKYIQKVQQSKVLPKLSQVKVQLGSATIIRTSRECHKQNAPIIRTYMECRDKKYIQGIHIETYC